MKSGAMRWIVFAWLLLVSVVGNAATPMVSASGNSSLFLHSDGTVWGTGDVTNYWPGALSPVRLLELPGVIAVASAGGGTDFALLGNGTVWGTGGSLVSGNTTEYVSQPRQIPGLTGINAIAVAGHVLALKNDGTVWSWGRNELGQLGDGTRTDRYVPVQIAGLTNVVKISASGWGSLALRADGTVWVWGWTCCGAAGDGTAPDGHGDPESYRLVPTQVPGLDQVTAIAAGHNHHMVLRADGTVWTWGFGDLGQNGTGRLGHQLVPMRVPELNQIVAIEAKGFWYSLALRADGTVWAWGNNVAGQLGVSTITYSAVPIQVPGVSEIVAISAGGSHALALRRDGAVVTWGLNSNGQLGDNTFEDRAQPDAVLAPGASGQLNLLQPVPANYNRLPSAHISLDVTSGVAPLTVRASAVDAHDPDGSVTAYVWRTSAGHQATGSQSTFTFTRAGTYDIDLVVQDNAGGRGTARQLVVVTPSLVSGVSTDPKVKMGDNGSVALTNNGSVLVWAHMGSGHYDSQFEFSLPEIRTYPIANGIMGAVDAAIGSATVHVVLADGSVLGWGANNVGEVGSGTVAIGVQQPQLLPGLPPVKAVAAKWGNFLALTRDGRVFSWGGNSDGELGLGDYENRYAPVEVQGLDNVIAVATGFKLSVALKSDGTVWAWGRNEGFQLGDGTQVSRNRPSQVPGLTGVTKIFVTDGIFALKADGTTWATGFLPVPIPGDLGLQSGARHVPAYDGVVQIAGDYQHIIALKADGTVWTGGRQSSLALGFESAGDIPGLQQLPGISDAIWVEGASKHSMVVRQDGTVLAWGSNHWGHLGDGTLARQITPVLVVNETIDGPLDLVAGVPNNIPPHLIPPFFLATYSTGDLSSLSLSADLRGVGGGGGLALSGGLANTTVGPQVTDSYNVYVAAVIPTGGTAAYYQMDSGYRWSPFVWPMGDFLRGVALGSQDALVRVNILQNVNLTPYIGASIIVGYGTDPDEMLSNARYRTIFTVTQQ